MVGRYEEMTRTMGCGRERLRWSEESWVRRNNMLEELKEMLERAKASRTEHQWLEKLMKMVKHSRMEKNEGRMRKRKCR